MIFDVILFFLVSLSSSDLYPSCLYYISSFSSISEHLEKLFFIDLRLSKSYLYLDYYSVGIFVVEIDFASKFNWKLEVFSSVYSDKSPYVIAFNDLILYKALLLLLG